MSAESARRRGRPPKPPVTSEELLSRPFVSATEVAGIFGWSLETILRKERASLLPARRDVAGSLLFKTSDIKRLIEDAPEASLRPEKVRAGAEVAAARAAREKARRAA